MPAMTEIPTLRQCRTARNAVLPAFARLCYLSDMEGNMKIIAIVNQKGGTAKTITAAALSVLLSRQGTPVHLVDFDPQASLTRAFGISDTHDRLYNALTDRAELPVQHIAENLTISPSTLELSRAEPELLSEPGREHFLRVCLEKTSFAPRTIVILDSPPSLGVLAVNCLAVAGGLIAVVQPGGFELHALAHLWMTIEAIQERLHPDLHVLGAVITNAHRRRAITDQVTHEVERLCPVLGVVRSDARLLRATSAGCVHRCPTSNAMRDYAGIVQRLTQVLA
jgi:chromosome partitioning protein